jgi:hypothetical protein
MKQSSLFCAVGLTVTALFANFSQATDNEKMLYQFQMDNGGASVGGYSPVGALIRLCS